MAVSTNMLSIFRRVIDDSRRINPPPIPLPTSQAKCSLPTHSSLLPLLLDYEIPPAPAKALSEAYDRAALQIRRKTEALCSANNADSTEVYSAFLNMYQRNLRQWASKTLNTALSRQNKAMVNIDHWQVIQQTNPPHGPSQRSVKRRFFTKGGGSSFSNPMDSEKVSACLVVTQEHPHAFPTIYPPPIPPEPSVRSDHLATCFPTWRTPLLRSPVFDNSKTDMDIDLLANIFFTKLTIHSIPGGNMKRMSSTKPQEHGISSVATDLEPSPYSISPPHLPRPKPGLARVVNPPVDPKQAARSWKEMPVDIFPHSAQGPGSSFQSPILSNSIPNTTFTFSTKISGFHCQPAPPILDTTCSTMPSDKSFDIPSSVAPNPPSIVAHPPYRNRKSRKVASLPRRTPCLFNDMSRTCSDAPLSKLSRTPSLASTSSYDSDPTSSSPITPPSIHSELQPLFQDRLHYLHYVPGAGAPNALSKAVDVHPSLIIEGSPRDFSRRSV